MPNVNTITILNLAYKYYNQFPKKIESEDLWCIVGQRGMAAAPGPICEPRAPFKGIPSSSLPSVLLVIMFGSPFTTIPGPLASCKIHGDIEFIGKTQQRRKLEEIIVTAWVGASSTGEREQTEYQSIIGYEVMCCAHPMSTESTQKGLSTTFGFLYSDPFPFATFLSNITRAISKLIFFHYLLISCNYCGNHYPDN